MEIHFKKGMNILIGENDSGKSAILDAIKLVLKTHAYEWIKIEENDFYNEGDDIASITRIEIEFSGINDLEASNFTEWCGWQDEEVENESGIKELKPRPKLILIYQAELREGKIIPTDVRAGMDGYGYLLTAEAKEYLKCTYLKALRDADNELTAKKNSRLSQILKQHDLFKKKSKDVKLEFEKIFIEASDRISDEFKKPGSEYYLKIKKTIDQYIQSFINESSESKIDLGGSEISSILEKISLGILDHKNLGLGTMNRLFMAAELLHLKKENWNGLKLCMIEELEAHLHPQAQLKIVNRLKEEKDIQYILTTHSPNITSQADLKNIIICRNKQLYTLSEGNTKLEPKNYKYLERFLDVTKSNLFFSKGNFVVEGWSEEILLPELAKKLGYDLTKSEFSIINVASTAYLHFAKIFLRNDGAKMGIPISIITDLDNRPDIDGNFKDISEEDDKVKTKQSNLNKLKAELEKTDVILEIAKEWTLEWCLYKSCLSELFKNAIKETHPQVFKTFDEKYFIKSLSKQNGGTKIDKVALANELAILISEDTTIQKKELEEDKFLEYLIKAIKHVCDYGNKSEPY
ncbi:hypothetical protein FLJC2902T_13410 [Flavobacterium limnosediminis JC2902]|uniref:Uncharacterized protein n=1 Tax=Flavobacterium limnosediminis JC2902 TaxID=1341181 RepID=V6SRE1_9FLAO|nr:hypothetical protein FLJC2902T_13410 [Flavobacterium limnosediminis JC2902]